MDVSFWRLWLAENRAPKRQGDAEQARKGVASRFHGLEPNNYLTQKILWLEKTKTPTWIEENINLRDIIVSPLKNHPWYFDAKTSWHIFSPVYKLRITVPWYVHSRSINFEIEDAWPWTNEPALPIL